MEPRTKLLIGAIVGGFLALVIGLIVYMLIPKATVEFVVAPESLTVTINGDRHQVKNGDKLVVAPEEITIELSYDGFESYTQTFTLHNGETKTILYVLTPQTDAARALLQTTGAKRVMERFGGKLMSDSSEKLKNKYPLIAQLPVTSRFYTITACGSKEFPDDPSKLAVCITLSNLEAQDSAINEIRRLGFNPEDYEIIVVDASYTTLIEQAGE